MSLYQQYLKEKENLSGSLYEQYKREKFLIAHPKIQQYTAEAEQAQKRAKELSSPWGLAKETIKELPSAAKKVGGGLLGAVRAIGRYLVEAVKHPKETAAGAFGEAIFEPTIGITRLLGKKKLAEAEEEGLKEYYEQFAPTKEAREVGKFLGWMIPFSTAEKAIGKIPAITRLGKFAPAVKELGAWISTDQLLYNPKTDGSRAKQVLEDLAAFGVLKGIGKLYGLAKGKFAVRVADEIIKPIEKAMKKGEKVSLEEAEKAVNKAKKIVKAGTGKEPKELVNEEILKPIKPTIKPKVKPAITDELKPYIEQAKTAEDVDDFRDILISQGKAEEFANLIKKSKFKDLGEFWNKVRPDKPITPKAPELPVEAISKPRGIKAKKPVEAKIEGIPKEEKERMWLLVVEDRYIPTIFKERKKLQEIYLRGLREIRKYFPDAKIGYTKSSVLSPAARKILHLVTGEPEVLIEAQPKIFFKVKNHLFSIGQSGDWPLCRETSSGAVRIVKTKRYPYLAEIIEIKRRGHHAVSWDYKAKVSSWIRDLEKSDIEKLLKVKEIANKLGTDAALNIGGIETIPFPTEFLGIYKKLLQSPKGGVREIKVGEIKKISPPKIKPSEVKSLQVSEIPVVSKRKIPSGISEKAFRWIDFFFFGNKAEREKAFKLLTPEIKKEISKFKPNKPVRLYKYPGESELPQGFTYWTHDREFAQRLSGPGEFVSKVIKPKDILVDFTETPSNFPGEKGGIWGKGVIVKPSAVKGVKEVKIPKTLQKTIQRQEEGGGGVFKMRTRGAKEIKPKTEAIMPKELEPLAREARKYKSAEEFVKTYTFYRGQDYEGELGSFFTPDRKFASQFGKKVYKVYISPTDIYKPSVLPKATDIGISKGIDEAKRKGFKAFFVDENKVTGAPPGKISLYVFDKSAFKTKSQLKSLYNQAVKGVKEAKPILKETWQKISTYPKKGDYVRVNWKGKTYEGTITGEKPVRFRTGYVAREITTKEGVKKWMPWTSSAKYEVKVKETKLPEFPEKPSKSIELNASIVPGAKAISNFIDRDVVEPLKGKISFFSKVKILIKNWLNPPSDKKIKEATQIFLRQMKADVQQFKDQLWNAMDKRLKWWDRVPEEVKLAFMDKIEKGTITAKDFLEFGKDKAKVLADIAKEYRERLDKIYNLQKEYGDKLSYIENYFPHIWEKPDDARRFISSYIRKIGKPAFMKKRYYDFIKDGMKAGLKLKTTNPEELVIMREIGGYQYLKMKEFLDRMKEQGWLKFNKGLKRPPFGWKALDRNALKVYFPTEKGVVQAGEWIMPEPAANVVNNYLSPSLWSSPEWYGKVFRAFMKSKNAVVAIKLGLSTFHMVETTMSDLATNLSIALKKAGRKDFGGFLKTLAKTPIGPIESMRAGRIIKAWEKGPKTEWERQAVDLIKRAGGRPKMSDVWRIQAKKQWTKTINEFKAGNPIGGTIRIIPEILEAIQKPVLDWYVPRLKVSNFLRVAEDYISAHPNISERELDKYLTKLWDSIDNRFGQLVYDNLFWPRWVRDLGVASSLSMGWNLGTIREFGGGALDFTKLAAKLATKQGKAEITDRMIYSITYPLVFGTLGGLITYISTGKPPQELLDYYYPKTGNKNPDGSDERLQMPTMMKEFFSSKSALQKYGAVKGTAIYFWHKTNPLISIGLDILKNKDFYGVEIRDENAPAVKQAEQLAEYLGREALAPISISGYLRRKRISGKSSITPFIGFVPAPRYVTETPIQSKIYTLYSKRFGGQTKTREEWEKTQAKAEIRTLYLQGKDKEMREKIREAIKKGYIKRVSQFLKNCDLPSDIRAFKALPAEDQKGLISKMSLEEIKRYAWYVRKELKPKFSSICKNSKKFVELYRQGKIKRPVWKRQRLTKR